MTSSWAEFCEQSNPGVLSEARGARAFQNARRVQESISAAAEKRALVWMAERTPAWINSDHLTLLGFLAQILAGVGYALSRWNRYWLMAVIGFLALNWLGDSLDGTLARVRQRQRPRYGFYVDHMVDSFGALALMSGLAISGYMHPYIAIGLLVFFFAAFRSVVSRNLYTWRVSDFVLEIWADGDTNSVGHRKCCLAFSTDDLARTLSAV